MTSLTECIQIARNAAVKRHLNRTLKSRDIARCLCSFLIVVIVLVFSALARSRSLTGSIPSSQQSAQRAVAITVDDLPGAEPGTDHAIGNLEYLQKINRQIPATLRSHHVPGIGFVN